MKAIYLHHPHAGLIWVGDKTLIVQSRLFNVKKENYLLMDKDFAYGTLRIKGISRVSLDNFKELEKYHKIGDTERVNRWKGCKTFYTYHFTFKKFGKPKDIKIHVGGSFLREVDMTQDVHTYNPGDKTDGDLKDDWNLVCSNPQMGELAILILKEMFRRNIEINLQGYGTDALNMYKRTINRIKGYARKIKDEEMEETTGSTYPVTWTGTKKQMVRHIISKIPDGVRTVVDTFTGSGIVAYNLKKSGYTVIANDRNYYSYCIGKALVECNEAPYKEENVDGLVDKLFKQNKGKRFTSKTFPKYWNDEMRNMFDSARRNANKQPEPLKWFLLAALGKSITVNSQWDYNYGAVTTDRIRNSVKSALKKFMKMPIQGTARVFYGDSFSLLKKLKGKKIDMVYLDPPYLSDYSSKAKMEEYPIRMRDQIAQELYKKKFNELTDEQKWKVHQEALKRRDTSGEMEFVGYADKMEVAGQILSGLEIKQETYQSGWTRGTIDKTFDEMLKLSSTITKNVMLSYMTKSIPTRNVISKLLSRYKPSVKSSAHKATHRKWNEAGKAEAVVTELIFLASGGKTAEMEKKKWSKAQGVAWCDGHGKKSSQYEKITNYHVFRQRDPEGCDEFRGNVDPLKKGRDYGVTAIYCIRTKDGKRTAELQSLKFYHGEGTRMEACITKGTLKLYEFKDQKYLDIEGMIFRPGLIKNIPFKKEILMDAVLLPKKGHALSYVNWYHLKGEPERVGILKKTWWDPNYKWKCVETGKMSVGARLFKATITDKTAIDRIWNEEMIYVSPEVTFTEDGHGIPDTIQERGLALTNTPAIAEARITKACDEDSCKTIVDKR